MSQGQGRKTATYCWTSDAKISQKATISAMCGDPLLLGYSVAERNNYTPHSSPSNPLSISWKQSWGQALSVCDCWILASILSFRIFLLKVWFPVSLHRSNWNKRLNAESVSCTKAPEIPDLFFFHQDVIWNMVTSNAIIVISVPGIRPVLPWFPWCVR